MTGTNELGLLLRGCLVFPTVRGRYRSVWNSQSCIFQLVGIASKALILHLVIFLFDIGPLSLSFSLLSLSFSLFLPLSLYLYRGSNGGRVIEKLSCRSGWFVRPVHAVIHPSDHHTDRISNRPPLKAKQREEYSIRARARWRDERDRMKDRKWKRGELKRAERQRTMEIETWWRD